MSAAATFALTAGGTGGHLFPAQALAETLIRRGHRVVLMTDIRGAAYSNRFADVDVLTLPSASPAGGPWKKLRAAMRLTLGVLAARRILKRMAPTAIIGFGGYASFPPLCASWRTGTPLILHEQNAHLGRVNRLFATKAQSLALSFQDTKAVPAEVNTVLTGNPVRASVLAVRERAYAPPAAAEPIHLLVFGGSQGARIFSDTVPGAVAGLPDKLRRRVRVTQQVPEPDLARVRAAYAEAGIEAVLAPFFDDMATHLSAAHLVLARAGASTCAELAAAGRPGVLAPYPYAADDHQTANAHNLVAAGAAVSAPDARLDAAGGARILTALLEDPAALARMAKAAFALAVPDAAERLADLAEQAGASA